MHLILAEDIGPWLFNAMVLFAGLGTTVLALGAIAPAIYAKRVLTVCLIAPAFIISVSATCWLVRDYIRTGTYDHDHFVDNLLEPWIPMAGLPLVTSIIVGTVLFFRARRRS